MKRIVFALLFLFAAGSIQAQDYKHFGDEITPDGAVELTELRKKMEKADELSLKVSGEIESCCAKKGCWMILEDENGESVRVTFKDYGFFVPLDSQGKKVVMEGKAFYKITPIDELRHYAEDAGKSKKEIRRIKKPQKELRFEATGVIIYS